jgi:hypothetical protein
VPSRQANDYYGKILNVSREMAKDKKHIPQECYQKAFNIFGCSYVFCSSDGKALLMKTSREDCEEIGTWYVIGSFIVIYRQIWLIMLFATPRTYYLMNKILI